jgi:hypothetical protein
MAKLLPAVLVVVALASASPAGAAERHPICGPTAAKTVKKTDRLRVYAVRGRYGVSEYVCSRHSKRVWELTEPYSEDDECGSQGCGYQRMRLLVAGRWVLQVIAFDGPDLRYFVELRAAGARRPSWFAGMDFAHDAVLHPGGGAAWIATRNGRTTVERAAGCGPSELDEGAGIARTSLALDGDRVTWTGNGEPRAAELCFR